MVSQSPNDENDTQGQLPRTFTALGKMLREGRSFSGRERNRCFLNTLKSHAAGGRFANVSATSGIDFPDDGRAVAQVDWDQDGDLDLWISNRNAPRLRFLRNDLPQRGNFVSLRLVGHDSDTNRDAIGARVEVVTDSGSPRLVKSLRAGEGFLAQSSKWLHFGLGDARAIKKVVVRWPSARRSTNIEEFDSVRVGHRYRLIQGTGRAEKIDIPNRDIQLTQSSPDLPPRNATARLILLTRLPVLPLRFEELSGAQARLPVDSSRPVLVNLWSPTCQPCIEELVEFSKRASEIRRHDLEVVALSIDNLSDYGNTASSDPESGLDLSQRFLKQIEFPFLSGKATRELVTHFRRLLDYQIPMVTELPLPTSFLVDRQGCLAAVYKGPVTVDDLLEDVELLDVIGRKSSDERLKTAGPIAGRAVKHPVLARAMSRRETQLRFLLANDLRRGGHLREAEAQYASALELDPGLVQAHHYLGLIHRTRGRLDDAQASFERALRLRPDSVDVRNDLGVVLFRKGDLRGAKTQYERVLQLDSEYIDSVMNLGILSARQGSFVRAAELFQRVLAIDPRFAPAHLQLGRLAERQDQLTNAAEHYTQAVRLKRDYVDAHNNLGVVFAKLGDREKARSHFERAVSINPRLAEAHNNLGLLDEFDGRLTSAQERYLEALRLAPNYSDAKRNLDNVRGLLRRRQSPQR